MIFPPLAAHTQSTYTLSLGIVRFHHQSECADRRKKTPTAVEERARVCLIIHSLVLVPTRVFDDELLYIGTYRRRNEVSISSISAAAKEPPTPSLDFLGLILRQDFFSSLLIRILSLSYSLILSGSARRHQHSQRAPTAHLLSAHSSSPECRLELGMCKLKYVSNRRSFIMLPVFFVI